MLLIESVLRAEHTELEREDVSEGGAEGPRERRSAYKWRARQPWLWKKCAIAREDVVNVGRSGAYGFLLGGGRGWTRM